MTALKSTVGPWRPDIRLSEVLAGLSYALDLTEGQRPGHAVRSSLIGMRLARQLGMSEEQQSHLFYALLMKDLGCSSNAARFAVLFGANDHDVKADLKTTNWLRNPMVLKSILLEFGKYTIASVRDLAGARPTSGLRTDSSRATPAEE